MYAVFIIPTYCLWVYSALMLRWLGTVEYVAWSVTDLLIDWLRNPVLPVWVIQHQMKCVGDNQWWIGKDLLGYNCGIFKVIIVANA